MELLFGHRPPKLVRLNLEGVDLVDDEPLIRLKNALKVAILLFLA